MLKDSEDSTAALQPCSGLARGTCALPGAMGTDAVRTPGLNPSLATSQPG